MLNANPLISVVIPVYDQWPLTRACIQSLRTASPGSEYEVILVDNGSTDATPSECPALGEALFGRRFTYVHQPSNLGFARGINAGVDKASGRYVFLLNNDTVITSDIFGPLVETLQDDPTLGAVGPLLLYPGSQRVQHLGVAVAHFHKFVHLYHMFPATHDAVRRPRRLQAITGAAMLLDRNLFLSLKGLDPEYVNGMEDIDLCAALKEQGYSCALAPQAAMEHHVGQTATRGHAEGANNRHYQRKRPGVLVPDMDSLAAEDGYELRFTPWLDPYLEPGPDRLAAVERELEGDISPSHVLMLLEKEPCWAQGYSLLARHFEASHDLDGALGVRLRQSAFLPLDETTSEIQRLATVTGNRDALGRIAVHRKMVEQAMRYRSELQKQAIELLEWSRETGNARLSSIIKRWFASVC